MSNGAPTSDPSAQPQEIAINTLPFWSRFTLTADLHWDQTNLLRKIIGQGAQRKVFDYRQGERNVSALEGAQSTSRDTILVQANQTRGGGLYRILGISYTKDGMPYVVDDADPNGLQHDVYIPNSMQPGNGASGPVVLTVEDFRALDSFMTHLFTDNFRTQINIDGTRRVLEMGPGVLYPGVGGATGGNVDTVNGAPFISNYMEITEGIVWNPAGAVDSNFSLTLECNYDVFVPTWTAPNAVFAGAVPTAMGREWTVGYIANLHGREESPTSDVS